MEPAARGLTSQGPRTPPGMKIPARQEHATNNDLYRRWGPANPTALPFVSNRHDGNRADVDEADAAPVGAGYQSPDQRSVGSSDSLVFNISV